MTDAEKLQAVYDGENHFCMTVCWDAGFEVTFGTDHHLPKGVRAHGIKHANPKTASEAVNWLYECSQDPACG